MDANKEYPAFIGIITEMLDDLDEHGCKMRARVVPITAQDAPTRPFYIHYLARGPICDLKLRDKVWCLRAENGEGLILARLDGSCTGTFPGDITIREGVTVNEDASIGGKSFLAHTHQGVHGETSAPL